MTYFGFLIRYVVIPIAILLVVHLILYRRGRGIPDTLRGMPAIPTVLAHILVALIYTTPWDNYLVATGVWYYNPELVSGVVIGWVPIEEYTFFMLQPILTGSWLLLLAILMNPRPLMNWARPRIRTGSVLVVGLVWVTAVIIFLSGWAPGTYLSITLAWALPPILLQLAIGADILWRYRRLVFWSLVPITLYLSIVDSLAIGEGTWTIDPAQSLNILLFGVLPVEEAVFFLLTNTLLVFGITLVLARESHARLHNEIMPWISARIGRDDSGSKSRQPVRDNDARGAS